MPKTKYTVRLYREYVIETTKVEDALAQARKTFENERAAGFPLHFSYDIKFKTPLVPEPGLKTFKGHDD